MNLFYIHATNSHFLATSTDADTHKARTSCDHVLCHQTSNVSITTVCRSGPCSQMQHDINSIRIAYFRICKMQFRICNYSHPSRSQILYKVLVYVLYPYTF